MSSRSFITVDWSKLSSRYDSVFGTRSASGGSKAPTVSGVWNRLVDFLTANFQRMSYHQPPNCVLTLRRASKFPGWSGPGHPPRIGITHPKPAIRLDNHTFRSRIYTCMHGSEQMCKSGKRVPSGCLPTRQW